MSKYIVIRKAGIYEKIPFFGDDNRINDEAAMPWEDGMIDTTVYIRKDIAKCINIAARASDKTRTEVVVLLMKRAIKDHRGLVRSMGAVQYQKKEQAEEWSRMHISPTRMDYDYCIDMRKFFRRSVSLLLALAVEKYLDEIIAHGDLKTDNYQYNGYCIVQEMIGNVVCWKIFWGIPTPASLLFPSDPA